jgi:hypothetical protein
MHFYQPTLRPNRICNGCVEAERRHFHPFKGSFRPFKGAIPPFLRGASCPVLGTF